MAKITGNLNNEAIVQSMVKDGIKARIAAIKEESYPPGFPTPPPDKEEWVPGCLGLRFSKWLRKWRKKDL